MFRANLRDMRIKIAALMLVMIALPFVLGDPFPMPTSTSASGTASVATMHSPTLPGKRDDWWDFARTLIGVFAGAGAAFYANFRLQLRARRLEQVSAGNFAMATLTRQYNGFMNARKGLLEEFAASEAMPDVPVWLAVKPLLNFIPDDITFDFESLTFLFETRDVEFFEHLYTAEGMHRDFFGFLRQFNAAAAARIQRLEMVGKKYPKGAIPLSVAIKAVGPGLTGELEATLNSLKTHCEEDCAIYLRAASTLHRCLSNHFGAGVPLLRLVGPES